MTDEPTIQDVFRVVNDMRTEVRAGLESMRADIADLRGELRAAKRDLGEDIDAVNARMTADKASTDELLAGIRQDLSRHSTVAKSALDGHTARFRTIDSKLNELKDQTKAIIERLDRAHIPAE